MTIHPTLVSQKRKGREREKDVEGTLFSIFERERLTAPKLVKSIQIFIKKKSRIRDTKHLSTDADSSTDTAVWWTRNTQKPIFFKKQKKLSKTQKLKNF